MSYPKITPMIKQYLSIKKEYSDAILFYRMGDFYEMFFEDAKKASRILGITLTSRNKKGPSQVPMCGIPYKSAQTYLAKLIGHGCKVAICDQVEDAATARGLVKRDVVRVITPGMIIEDELLDEKTNNFLLSLTYHEKKIGLSYLDISTGTFRLSETDDLHSIIDEARRISPSEIILPEFAQKHPVLSSAGNAFSEKIITYVNDDAFEYTKAEKKLTEQFRRASLKTSQHKKLNAGICAAGAILYYVRETQKQKTEHFTKLETYSLDSFLLLDNVSCKNLEIFSNLNTGEKKGSLFGILDQTVTSMGGRLLKTWLRYPMLDIDKIRLRQNAVKEAKDNIFRVKKIRESLKSVYDMERLGSRISLGHSTARDLIALKRSLKSLPDIWSGLSEFSAQFFKKNIPYDFTPLTDILEKSIREDAPPSLNNGGIIKEGYNSELDELVEITQNGKTWIARLEAKEKKETGINSLKVRYNKVFGYYIEIPKAKAESMPSHYVRKQTLVNAERYITDELKKFEYTVLSAQEKRSALEYEIFTSVRKKITEYNYEIQETARFIAKIDSILALALVADQNDYIMPEINPDGDIKIENGRHPVVEKMITGERFVPNSLNLNNKTDQILIITGPNMAGKSTVLRQTAILAIMTQIGSFIPAESASICITDKIFTRVGALDNLSAGQSTFMVEMTETAAILKNATPESFIILDEIGRGTSTFDGLSIAWAVVEYLHDLKKNGVKTLFATHYHELTKLALIKPRIKNFNIAVKEEKDEIIFLRKLIKGETSKSYGIQVASLAGIPDKVIKRSMSILASIEKKQRSKKRSSVSTKSKAAAKNGHKQLCLFKKSS